MQVSKIMRQSSVGYTFFCPGCKQPHQVFTHPPRDTPRWTYNGNPDTPTFHPSLLLTGAGVPNHEDRDFTKEEEAEYEAILEKHKGQGHAALMTAIRASKFGQTCHSFIRDGMIQFLDDCTHPLKGQTVPLPDLPEYMQGDNFKDS